MDRQGYIEVEGLDKIIKALENCDKAAYEGAMTGLEEVATNIVNDSIANLRNNGSWASGLLAESGHVSRKKDGITAGFFDTGNKDSGYALYVEFGRRSGKMPPPDEFDAWIQKKMEVKDPKERLSIGWALAKHIAKVGTQPHPFFIPAVNKNTKSGSMRGVEGVVGQRIMKAIRNATASFAFEGRRIRNTPKE